VPAFRDTDYPEFFQLDIGEAILTVTETSLLPLDAGNNSYYSWNAILPVGYGFTHAGPEERFFGLSMGHQLHCLQALRNALVDPDRDFSSLGHSQHCLNYLRQRILCNPDLTLEPFDSLDGSFTVEAVGATHVCRDWSAVYEGTEERWKLHKQKQQ
jgi:hypothetical protein